MAKAFMAYPELRDPYVVKDIHPKGCATILYQGKAITLSDVRAGDGLLIKPKDLREINGFEEKLRAHVSKICAFLWVINYW